MRIWKIMLIVSISIIVLYVSFFTIDFIRLKDSSDSSLKPIITLKEIESYNRKLYYSLGYSIEYYTEEDNNIYGLEFKLFNTFLIYGWVE